MTIAEQIEMTLATINDWADQYTSTYGIVFNKVKPENLDNAITRYANEGDWCKVLTIKRKAEIVGYSSITIDEKVKEALTNIELFNCKLPKMPDGWWYNWYYHLLNGFRYAKELNHETEKWGDPLKAYRGLRTLRENQTKYFYKANPDTGAIDRIGEGSWHEASALAGTWLKFYELMVHEALDMVGFEWREFNRIYYVLSTEGNHYIYRTDNPDFEMRNGTVFQTWAKAFKFSFIVSENFLRIPEDLTVRYLKNLWLSPQWGNYKVVVAHNPSNPDETRLDGTLEGWAALHMFYRFLIDEVKANMRNMLLGKGVTKASDAILESPNFDPVTNKFRISNLWSYSDRGAVLGCAALFLTAIAPETGSLAIPIRAEGIEMYELDFFEPHHFGFNFESRQIKIPVYAGKLQFTFGDKPVEAKFPYDGIYTVTFSEDWGKITAITRVGDLDQLYLFNPAKPTPIEVAVGALVAGLGFIPIYHLGKTVVRKVKERG